MLAILGLPAMCRAQVTRTLVEFTVNETRVHVVITLRDPITELSFRDTYGPVIGLAQRVRGISAFTETASQVESATGGIGWFKFKGPVNQVEYQVLLSDPKKQTDRSHVSWIGSDYGVLMLADLVPQMSSANSAMKIRLNLPPAWSMASTLKQIGGFYETSQPEKTVFLIGRGISVRSQKVEGREFSVATVGGWLLSGQDGLRAASRIVKHYSRVTGLKFPNDSLLILLPLNAAGVWTAETRGNTIVLLVNRNEPKEQLVARLSIILTHEIFHLWIPGSLSLKGDYDWFFEGFTLYQALISAVQLKLINFDEYLNTLARVYDSYLLTPDKDQWSLIALSERRWTSAPSLPYDKGMLVALVYDLRLRASTRGKMGLPQVYPKLFQLAQTGSTDANEAIITVLERAPGMHQFSRFVTEPQTLDLEQLLSPFGIEVIREGFQTRLTVRNQLNAIEREVLGSLGYKK